MVTDNIPALTVVGINKKTLAVSGGWLRSFCVGGVFVPLTLSPRLKAHLGSSGATPASLQSLGCPLGPC